LENNTIASIEGENINLCVNDDTAFTELIHGTREELMEEVYQFMDMEEPQNFETQELQGLTTVHGRNGAKTHFSIKQMWMEAKADL
jgi:hypothetical protein